MIQAPEPQCSSIYYRAWLQRQIVNRDRNTMDERQATLKNMIHAVVTRSESDEITYRSEWLGYMPFPVFQWVEYQGKSFSSDFPFDWTLEDLTSLERTGFLEKLEAYENPEDPFDRDIRYRVHVGRV